MSRRQLQSLQEHSGISGLAFFLAQLQVMLQGWFPQSCILQGLASGSQGRDEVPAAVLGVMFPKSPFWVNTFHYRCV